MNLIRLIYFSQCNIEKDAAGVRREMANILAKASMRNQEDGITGALMLQDGCFAQVLEGNRRCVTQAFGRICNDPRHRAVEILESKPITERVFPFWSLAQTREVDPTLILRFSGCARFEPHGMCAESILQLISTVIRDQAPARVYAYSA